MYIIITVVQITGKWLQGNQGYVVKSKFVKEQQLSLVKQNQANKSTNLDIRITSLENPKWTTRRASHCKSSTAVL